MIYIPMSGVLSPVSLKSLTPLKAGWHCPRRDGHPRIGSQKDYVRRIDRIRPGNSRQAWPCRVGLVQFCIAEIGINQVGIFQVSVGQVKPEQLASWIAARCRQDIGEPASWNRVPSIGHLELGP